MRGIVTINITLQDKTSQDKTSQDKTSQNNILLNESKKPLLIYYTGDEQQENILSAIIDNELGFGKIIKSFLIKPATYNAVISWVAYLWDDFDGGTETVVKGEHQLNKIYNIDDNDIESFIYNILRDMSDVNINDEDFINIYKNKTGLTNETIYHGVNSYIEKLNIDIDTSSRIKQELTKLL